MRIGINNVFTRSITLIMTGLTLSACGSGSSNNPTTPVAPVTPTVARGALLQAPQRVAAFDVATVTALINSGGAEFAAISGTPKCGIDVHHMEYGTVGAAGESATSSGALLVPTGNDPACQGKRPILLYGHGSSMQHRMNMAELNDPTNEGSGRILFPAALFAAQGYIVVAPNYAGYDTSNLNYHPHHIADQNGKEMIDALTAAKAALPTLPTPAGDNGKLFLTGYSEGGYQTMAAHRAMQLAGIAVTASAPLSGSYAESVSYEQLGTPGALEAMSGSDLSVRTQLVMQLTAWQKAGNPIYATPADIYSANYSNGMETLLPTDLSMDTLVSSGKFPPYLIANDIPGYASLPAAQQATFGPPAQSLLKSSYLAALLNDIAANPCPVTSVASPLNCTPTHPARKAWLANDLRTWTPTAPMLMCGGNADPEVGFYNAQLTQAYFAAHGADVPILDVDSPIADGDTYALAKHVFTWAKNSIIQSGGDPYSSDNYHGAAVFWACHVAARDYFSHF